VRQIEGVNLQVRRRAGLTVSFTSLARPPSVVTVIAQSVEVLSASTFCTDIPRVTVPPGRAAPITPTAAAVITDAVRIVCARFIRQSPDVLAISSTFWYRETTVGNRRFRIAEA
jgi:hypothetical protein